MWLDNPAIFLSSRAHTVLLFSFLPMIRIVPLLLVAATLASCTAARDERLRIATADRKPQPHTTIVDCPLYDGMTKTSTILAQSTSGSEVQVTDTVNAYFVKVRIDHEGKTTIGYMDRRCFGMRGNK